MSNLQVEAPPENVGWKESANYFPGSRMIWMIFLAYYEKLGKTGYWIPMLYP